MLENKYKDKQPLETIQNIKDFFDAHNCTYNVNIGQPLDNIWCCTITLYFDNDEILTCNGKGVTKEYCLASGYAELYERYCTEYFDKYSNSVPLKVEFDKIARQDKQSLYVYNIDDSIGHSLKLKQYFDCIKDSKGYWKKCLEILYPKGIINYCFHSLDDNEEKQLPLDLLPTLGGSDGYAAGNTINEAIVQASSEICEHYVMESLFLNHNVKYYRLSIKDLQLPEYIINIINQIEEYNDLYIYDLSYTYNLPVIGVMIVNKKTGIKYFNLGSSPIFLIALERCLTELFQGRLIDMSNLNKSKMKQLKEEDLIEQLELGLRQLTFCTAYPDELFDNYEIKLSFNDKIFLSNFEQTNQDLRKYYIDLFKEINWNAYYIDISQADTIKAVYVYIDNIMTSCSFKILLFNQLTDKEKIKYWKLGYYYQQFGKDGIWNIKQDLIQGFPFIIQKAIFRMYIYNFEDLKQNLIEKKYKLYFGEKGVNYGR